MKCKICGDRIKIAYSGLYDDRHGYPGRFDLRKCINCGFIQTRPPLNRKQILTIYSKYYPRQNVNLDAIKNAGKNIPSRRIIWEKGLAGRCHLDTKPGEKVLDIGSGIGSSLVEIEALGGEAWGVDPDANAKMVAKKLRLKFHHGFLDDAGLPRNYFDLITASQVLEHEPNPLKMLKDCKKFLKNNGRIRMSFPNTEAMYRKLWGKQWLHWHLPYHLNHFNRKSVELLTKKAGLRITEFKTVTPNLWTILQIRSWATRVRKGERNVMWDTGQVDKNKVRESRGEWSEWAVKLLTMSDKLLMINRLVDVLGWGESFIIEFKNKEDAKCVALQG